MILLAVETVSDVNFYSMEEISLDEDRKPSELVTNPSKSAQSPSKNAIHPIDKMSL